MRLLQHCCLLLLHLPSRRAGQALCLQQGALQLAHPLGQHQPGLLTLLRGAAGVGHQALRCLPRNRQGHRLLLLGCSKLRLQL